MEEVTKHKFRSFINLFLFLRGIIHLFHVITELIYSLYDSIFSYKSTDSVLFVDLGANLGQGYTWFSTFFNKSNIKFELFEPNPNCTSQLEEMRDVKSGKVKLHKVGVGVKNGTVKFYGLDNSEGGAVSQGGSIVKEHNSSWYEANSEYAIDVEIIDFSEYLKEKANSFDKIFVKMDIESAELELLEKLILDKSIDLINVLYVEFHSRYQEKISSQATNAREKEIIKDLKDNPNVKLRIWW